MVLHLTDQGHTLSPIDERAAPGYEVDPKFSTEVSDCGGGRARAFVTEPGSRPS